MNRVFLNNQEITSFDNDQDTIEFAEKLLTGKTEFEYDKSDDLEIELEEQGMISVYFDDLDENNKLDIF